MFTAIVGVLVHRLVAGRIRAALLAAVALSVLGAVVPLLVPNPYMPDAIRFPHRIETGVSNFLWAFRAALALATAAGTAASGRPGWPEGPQPKTTVLLP